jgi:hypothetical protein
MVMSIRRSECWPAGYFSAGSNGITTRRFNCPIIALVRACCCIYAYDSYRLSSQAAALTLHAFSGFKGFLMANIMNNLVTVLLEPLM